MIGPIPMIVTEAAKNNSGEVFNILDDDGGGVRTFSVALSPSGGANATHWATYTYLQPAVENALRNMSVIQFKAYADAEAARKGRPLTGSVTAFKNSLQMGQVGEDFWGFIAASGLKLVS